MVKAIQPEGLPPVIGAYSSAVQAGPWIYVSGQLPPSDEARKRHVPKYGVVLRQLTPEEKKAEVLYILENIERILAAAGGARCDIVKTTVYLRDMSEFSSVNEAYSVFFAEPYPARVCIQVSGLPRNAWVEIDAIAFLTASFQ